MTVGWSAHLEYPHFIRLFFQNILNVLPNESYEDMLENGVIQAHKLQKASAFAKRRDYSMFTLAVKMKFWGAIL